jgi:aryl-alcohol dehydrogenase-like predicted oxidoreductase
MTHAVRAETFAHPPSTLKVGDREVRRMGYGAMRLPGKDVWGPPEDAGNAKKVVRRAVDLGVQFIDTSWYYGPHVSNPIIAEAIHPYPKDLIIATKLGGKRTPDKGWAPFNRPEELRLGCEHDLQELRLETLDLVHLRFIPNDVPFLETLDTLIQLRVEGKLRHIGLSNVNTAQVKAALERTSIVTVQNLFNVSGGSGFLAKTTHAEVDAPEKVLDFCTANSIAYLPFFPLAVGTYARAHGALDAVATRHGASQAQVALAWLLARSPVMLPIPGTASLAHLEENWAASSLRLTPEEVTFIAQAARI